MGNQGSNAAPKTRRFDPAFAMVALGIILVMFGFAAGAIWQLDHAVYILVAGVIVLIGGFVLGSRSG